MNLILPSLPLLNLIYYLLSFVFGNLITSILFLPVSILFATLMTQNVPIQHQNNLIILLGIPSFFYSLPIFFKIYHSLIESTVIFSVLFWITFSAVSFIRFSIAVYNWVRLSWTVSSKVVSRLHSSKSVPNLKSFKSKSSLRSTKSNYFKQVSSNGNWSARYKSISTS